MSTSASVSTITTQAVTTAAGGAACASSRDIATITGITTTIMVAHRRTRTAPRRRDVRCRRFLRVGIRVADTTHRITDIYVITSWTPEPISFGVFLFVPELISAPDAGIR